MYHASNNMYIELRLIVTLIQWITNFWMLIINDGGGFWIGEKGGNFEGGLDADTFGFAPAAQPPSLCSTLFDQFECAAVVCLCGTAASRSSYSLYFPNLLLCV